MKLRRCLQSALLLLPFVSPVSQAITPNDVYREAREVIMQLEATQQKMAADKTVRHPGIQVGKTPLHVYTKTLELLEKIQRYNKENGLAALNVPELPNGKITPAKVMTLVSMAQESVQTINQKQGISLQTNEPLHFDKKPSDVYEQVWQASYLMDALVPPLKPADVLRNARMIEQGLLDIAKATRVDLNTQARPQIDSSRKTPTDVNIEAYRLLYKLARLQRKLGMKPTLVPGFPSGKVLPEDVYDTTGNILAEMIRINLHLQNNTQIKRQQKPTGQITPDDVYRQMAYLNALAVQLIK